MNEDDCSSKYDLKPIQHRYGLDVRFEDSSYKDKWPKDNPIRPYYPSFGYKLLKFYFLMNLVIHDMITNRFLM
jgi:hypothetical protein